MTDSEPEWAIPATNRRKHGRLICEGMVCSLGEVIDISASGLKVQATWSFGLQRDRSLKIRLGGFGCETAVPVRIRFIRRHGLFKCTMGLEFLVLTHDQQEVVSLLARRCVYMRAL